ncbi:MAG TPA: C4-type zinc ribbon domain-containing protein [Thermoanaerobaculia bacterium]|nr:C4-type zinc ribbon domain-containing protein [Thermoanaerobaculia bacterium]
MNQNLQHILELQTTLTQLREAEQRLHGIPDWMRELHAEHTTRKAEIETTEAASTEAARQRRTAEGAVSDAQEKLKKYQQQINKVSTQREYGALLQEIDTVKGQISSQEEAALAALDSSEKAEKELEALRESFREIEERYKTEMERWEGEKPEVARQVESLRSRAAEIKQRLPRNIVAQFERVLEKYPANAVTPVRLIERPGRTQREWSCTSCHYRVRPQTVVEIRNGETLVQCDSCKRILFYEEAEEA